MNYLILIITLFFVNFPVFAKESNNYLCHVRGYEIIFPYEHAIYKIKNDFKNIPEKKNSELKNLEENLNLISMVFLFINQQVVQTLG